MQYLAVDSLFPEFDIWTQFTTQAFSSALRLDSMNSSHPIEVMRANDNKDTDMHSPVGRYM